MPQAVTCWWDTAANGQASLMKQLQIGPSVDGGKMAYCPRGKRAFSSSTFRSMWLRMYRSEAFWSG